MSNNKWIILLLSLLFVACFIIGCQWKEMRSELQHTSDTVTIKDTLWKDTTITKTEYVPKVIKVVKKDTVYKDNGDTIELVRTQNQWEDTVISQKDTVTAQIYASGIDVTLDSINYHIKTHTEYVTTVITKTVQPKKTFKDRFGIGLQVGYGYGFRSKQLEPYVGIGVQYKF